MKFILNFIFSKIKEGLNLYFKKISQFPSNSSLSSISSSIRGSANSFSSNSFVGISICKSLFLSGNSSTSSLTVKGIGGKGSSNYGVFRVKPTPCDLTLPFEVNGGLSLEVKLTFGYLFFCCFACKALAKRLSLSCLGSLISGRIKESYLLRLAIFLS